MERTYIAIDLKSFYASVECVERHLDPLSTHLVVADLSRTEKTICLAVSPSLKAYGISGRARLFEVIQQVKIINRDRLKDGIKSGDIQKNDRDEYQFASQSFDAHALAEDPTLELGYITAPPRMRLYEEYSTKVYSIYLKYIAAQDIHVYSIDEVFLDVTGYLSTYQMTPWELAMTMIREVLYTTGITATAGIGTNMYLAKVAMDIVAKHVPADQDGVRIAELDEISYRQQLWTHKPLTDFWRLGHGYATKLAKMGLTTMGDIARASLSAYYEDKLYHVFGVNAELLIDHAWGWEPTEIRHIKTYQPQNNSLSSGQVLHTPYDFEHGRLIVKEMTELLVLDMVRKHWVTDQMVLTIGYDRESLSGENGNAYQGALTMDLYGRIIPKHAHGTANLKKYSSSTRLIMEAILGLYDRIVNPALLIRRLNIVAAHVLPENAVPRVQSEQISFLADDYHFTEEERLLAAQQDKKEKDLQRTMLRLQDRFGKNAILKGFNLQEGATTIERNQQIGGHKA